MTVLASKSRNQAIWATRSDRAEDLARIQDAGIAAAIWHRSRDPGFAAWIDSLPPDELPRLRALVAVPAVESVVQAACEAADLPPSPWRDMLAGDSAALAALFGAIMATPLVQLRLDVIQTDACKRFHLDRVPARLLCTYRGRGTEFGPAAPEGGVTRISALAPAEAAIFRGSLWRHEDCGLLHRSPPITGTGETRLLLVIDLPEDEDNDCDCGQPH